MTIIVHVYAIYLNMNLLKYTSLYDILNMKYKWKTTVTSQ